MKVGIIPYQHDTDFVFKDSDINLSKPSFPLYLEIEPTIANNNSNNNEEIDDSANINNNDYDNNNNNKTNLKFFKTEDIPLNRRNFIYRPCSANPLFNELGYCCSEYPFDKVGISIMDRSDGMSMLDKGNEIVGVKESLGWRTGRCDICIKEGLTYWEVEILNGGSPNNINDPSNDKQKKREILNSTSHLRLGISRREASLEGPVGFDAYGYGIRDSSLESIHEGKLSQILQPLENMVLKKGDRIGFLLELPDIDTQIEQAKTYIQNRIDALIEHNANKKKTKLNNNHESQLSKDFQISLLQDIKYDNVVRDHIPIRYKNQLFFEMTDYVKTTKPEYYSSNKQERLDYYKLKGSSLKIYLNNQYIGESVKELKPFLPPFSELQYNKKFYYNYWKHGETAEYSEEDHNAIMDDIPKSRINHNTHSNGSSKHGLILRNKYVNNNRLGYYPTISCFNGGIARLVVDKKELKFFDQMKGDLQNNNNNNNNNNNTIVKTLDILFKEQVAEDVLWDIIDEIEEESNNGTLISAYNMFK
ncbi:hypothetical protein TBLA_0C03110 [Henningerozyma blattae CBS 6284]|uniref:SPRY domain-containing protein n=1 Tax=Henningerozyma blattae (strain ATCC 34711 / CBS 6284 / DSM 70876 / NBRC 10599 / NRRL Y-10934 / UCD 77-7) TaxID=1071380 RepID=I2H163_HENB6|nr:hypothetical protein TBLA_0C03110 [Tetrapisispora blattae CBS 6284]CCH60115.1 hypothetical protein TBLA_0C03110 [Tetrapisispora blattae CBS 6284]